MAVLAPIVVAPVAAQGPPPGANITFPIPDAAIPESLAVLHALEARVRANSEDAAAWHHIGMISWLLMFRDRVGKPYPGLDWTLLGREADTALRIARSIDKKNPRYLLRQAQFLLGNGPMTVRVQAPRLFDQALQLAKESGDRALIAEANIERARVAWRKYEDMSNRRVGVDIKNIPDCGQAIRDWGGPVRMINNMSEPLPPDQGGATAYGEAEKLFRDAYAEDPASQRAFREVAMVLVEKKRWRELDQLAGERVRRAPAEALGWFALGLAQQRRDDHAHAEASFDSAMARLDAQERGHILNLKRLLAPQDTDAFDSLSVDRRGVTEARYWRLSDPLWSRGGDDAKTEFLARVAHADLRYTVEELGVRGLDSDRGEFLVRWGPPDLEVRSEPRPDRIGRGGNAADEDVQRGSRGVDASLQAAEYGLLWAYEGCPVVVFRGNTGYATMRVPAEDGPKVDSTVRATPSLWRNALDIAVAPMPSQVARFRSPSDSVDVFVAVEPPVRGMLDAIGANGRVHLDAWLVDFDGKTVKRDSLVVLTPLPRSWTYRVAPSTYAYRVEATADGASMAAMATDTVLAGRDPSAGFDVKGFGISDPLLAGHVEEHGVLRRWSDLAIVPTAGTVPMKSEIAIVWENYELGNANGDARYSVQITVRRKYQFVLNQIKARIVGALAAMAGVDRTEDQVVFRWDRAAPHASTIVDHLTIALDETPPGTYSLILGITDNVTGKYAERATKFEIRQ